MLSNLRLVKGTLSGVLFFCSFQVLAQNWQDLQWQRMLLYRKSFFSYTSEADHENFFSHKDGKHNPEKELEAFIDQALNEDPDPKKSVHCRFPARIRWLKKFREVPESKVTCDSLEAFRKRLSAKSISVVFSSYYLNNPGSSFGHTFIRLGKQSAAEKASDTTTTELLDTGINYGALTDGAGPVLFAVGGLAGLFYGNYNAVQYYYKVREYNDYETRDLWSYELDMTQEEIDFIVDYVWELGNTLFKYYFLTENCSYHVLSILEAARPSLNLHAHMPRLYTIPAPTLKALEAEGLISHVKFRPSASTLFYHQLNLLDEKEKKGVQTLIAQKTLEEEFPPERKALIFDTALSLVDYKYAKEILKGDEKAQSIKRPLLIGRSKIPVRSPEPDFSYKLVRAPHLGHGQKRVALSYLNSDHKNLLDLEWRFAFHDILDNDIGYPNKVTLDIMKAIIRTNGEDYQLRDFSVVDVLMLGKRDDYNRSSSWKFKLGQWQTRERKKDLTTSGFIGGYGLSYELGIFNPYSLLHLENSYVSEKLHKYKLGYGGDLGVLTEFNHQWKLNSVLEWRAYPWEESRVFNEIRYSEANYGVGAFHRDYLDDGVQDLGLRFFKYL